MDSCLLWYILTCAATFLAVCSCQPPVRLHIDLCLVPIIDVAVCSRQPPHSVLRVPLALLCMLCAVCSQESERWTCVCLATLYSGYWLVTRMWCLSLLFFVAVLLLPTSALSLTSATACLSAVCSQEWVTASCLLCNSLWQLLTDLWLGHSAFLFLLSALTNLLT